MTCPKCGSDVSDERAQFCPYCGALLPQAPNVQAAAGDEASAEPLANGGVSPADGQKPRSARRGKPVGMIVGACVALALLIAMVATCPSKADHKAVLSQEVGDVAGEIASEQGGMSIAGMVASFATRQLADVAVNNMLDVSDYWVCSVGRIDTGSGKKAITVGVFGHVFTLFNKQKLKSTIYKELRDNGIDGLSPDDDAAPDDGDEPLDDDADNSTI